MIKSPFRLRTRRVPAVRQVEPFHTRLPATNNVLCRQQDLQTHLSSTLKLHSATLQFNPKNLPPTMLPLRLRFKSQTLAIQQSLSHRTQIISVRLEDSPEARQRNRMIILLLETIPDRKIISQIAGLLIKGGPIIRNARPSIGRMMLNYSSR